MSSDVRSNENPTRVTVWWTPDCGCLHVEDDPASISPVCPDGLAGWAAADVEPPESRPAPTTGGEREEPGIVMQAHVPTVRCWCGEDHDDE